MKNIILTDSQKKAIDEIINGNHKRIFLTGKAGTGKSCTANRLIERLMINNITISITATTGIAALHIKGSTLYQSLGITANDLISKRYRKKKTNHDFSIAEYVIIDECSMMTKDLYDAMEYMIEKSIVKDKKIIFIGDLNQIPPVNKYSGNIRFEDQLFYIVKDLHLIMLTEVLRQDDKDFLNILNRISDEGYFEGINDYFSDDYYIKDNEDYMYSKIASVLIKASEVHKNVPYIASLNKYCDIMNDCCISLLKDHYSREYTYELYMDDDIDESLKEAVKKDSIENIGKSIKLYIGEKIMITSNEKAEEGSSLEYANGTIGTITGLEEGLIRVQIWNEDKEISLYPITNRFSLDYEENGKKKRVSYSVRYLPVIPAYAITAHKSQGMTVEEAFIDTRGIFEQGQLYTMISRIRTLKGIHLIKPIESHEVIINRFAVDYYRFYKEHGRTYNADELEFLRDIYDSGKYSQSTPYDEIRYLYDRKEAIEKYDEMMVHEKALIRNSLEAYCRKASFEIAPDEDMEKLIDMMLKYDHKPAKSGRSRKDPRLPLAVVEGINSGIKSIIDRWNSGEFDKCLYGDLYDYYLTEIPEITIEKEPEEEIELEV